jgi:hypothetical protein
MVPARERRGAHARRITPDYVRARWAYSELPSDRYSKPSMKQPAPKNFPQPTPPTFFRSSARLIYQRDESRGFFPWHRLIARAESPGGAAAISPPQAPTRGCRVVLPAWPNVGWLVGTGLIAAKARVGSMADGRSAARRSLCLMEG